MGKKGELWQILGVGVGCELLFFFVLNNISVLNFSGEIKITTRFSHKNNLW